MKELSSILFAMLLLEPASGWAQVVYGEPVSLFKSYTGALFPTIYEAASDSMPTLCAQFKDLSDPPIGRYIYPKFLYCRIESPPGSLDESASALPSPHQSQWGERYWLAYGPGDIPPPPYMDPIARTNGLFAGPIVFECNGRMEEYFDHCGTINVSQKNLGAPLFCPVGNPVNPANGNKYEQEKDFSIGEFDFTRTYNASGSLSSLQRYSPLGNWLHSFNRKVTGSPAGYIYTTAYLSRPDGKLLVFTKSGSQWLSDSDVNGTLISLNNDDPSRGGWVYKDNEGEVENYNNAGQLVSISRKGKNLFLTYTAIDLDNPANHAGLLSTVTDDFGKVYSLTYDAKYRIATISDPLKNIYSYSYTDNGYLDSVTYPDGTRKQYLYNEPALTLGADLPYALTGIIDEAGIRYATFAYDVNGHAISTEHADGVDKYTLSYDASSTYVTDPLGAARTYHFSNVLNTYHSASIDQPPGVGCAASSAKTEYDVNGNPTAKTDFNGIRTTFQFDLGRNLETSRTEAVGTAQERTITTTWSSSFRFPDTITEPGRITTFVYKADGNIQTKIVKDGTKTRKWAYDWNSVGQPLSVTDPDGNAVTYGYDGTGNLASVTDSKGHITRYTLYDADGNLLSMTDPNGKVTTFTWDARNRLKTRRDGTDLVTFDYWPTGLLKQATLPDSSWVHYDYDHAHRLLGITDSHGNSIAYRLDNAGNRKQETVYDPTGQLAANISVIEGDQHLTGSAQ